MITKAVNQNWTTWFFEFFLQKTIFLIMKKRSYEWMLDYTHSNSICYCEKVYEFPSCLHMVWYAKFSSLKVLLPPPLPFLPHSIMFALRSRPSSPKLCHPQHLTHSTQPAEPFQLREHDQLTCKEGLSQADFTLTHSPRLSFLRGLWSCILPSKQGWILQVVTSYCGVWSFN